MPSYDFICDRCGAEREVNFHRQVHTAHVKVACLACGEPMRKCFPTVGFKFTMSGAYRRQRAARRDREERAYDGYTTESTEYGEA